MAVRLALAIAITLCLYAANPADAAPVGRSTISLGAYVPFDTDMQEHYGQVWPALSYTCDFGDGSLLHRFGIAAAGITRKVSSGFYADAYGYPVGSHFRDGVPCGARRGKVTLIRVPCPSSLSSTTVAP